MIGYVGTFFLSDHTRKHTCKGYQQLEDYLSTTYPEKHFAISPQHFEQGVNVGEFQVHQLDTRGIGVTLRVQKDGFVSQLSTWTNSTYPPQQELWRKLQSNFLSHYTLDKELPEIKEVD